MVHYQEPDGYGKNKDFGSSNCRVRRNGSCQGSHRISSGRAQGAAGRAQEETEWNRDADHAAESGERPSVGKAAPGPSCQGRGAQEQRAEVSQNWTQKHLRVVRRAGRQRQVVCSTERRLSEGGAGCSPSECRARWRRTAGGMAAPRPG